MSDERDETIEGLRAAYVELAADLERTEKSEEGYRDAYRWIANALGIGGAMPITPAQHFESVMQPAVSTLAAVFAAIRVVDELHSLGDAVYAVRAAALDYAPSVENTWDHPRVLRYSAACKVIDAALKAHKERAP